jgi:glycosyltransferase involved in cell wall biosynthesis
VIVLAATRSKRLLSVVHHHPDIMRGGGQQAAYELFRGFASCADYEPFFLAALQTRRHPQLEKPGIRISHHDGRPNEFLLAVDDYDPFWLSNRDLPRNGWRDLVDFLRALQPDIIHVNHVLFVGIEFLRIARMVCPTARIVYTLHEFLPICHADGQMVRTGNQGLCDGATATRCALCFSDRGRADFFLRDRWVRAHFAVVDRFVAPSGFLRRRYIEWGIPEEDIVLIDYGRSAASSPRGTPPASASRNRFGFFGQLIDCKGLGCLIDAAAQLVARGIVDFELRLHGTNLDSASEPLRKKLAAALEALPQIRFFGSYANHDMLRLAAGVDWFVVPSIWWENSPLVIQEAFMARRPVLCSNIGGMAEKVRDGRDGLHFAVGDRTGLADAMARCLAEPDLWDRLSGNIPEVFTVTDAVAAHRRLCFEGELPPRRWRELWEAPWAQTLPSIPNADPTPAEQSPPPGARRPALEAIGDDARRAADRRS